MTAHYLLAVANPVLSNALAEATLDATPDEALDFVERLQQIRL